MIADEFLSIAGPALRHHRGADSVRVIAVEPTQHGPLVRWEGSLLASERERKPDGGASFVGVVPGPVILDVLARTLALRWRDGAPRIRKDWDEKLGRRHRAIFDRCSFECSGGWRWLWEAGAEMIKDNGIPKGFRSSQLKENFGTIRWYYDSNDDCEDTSSIIDAVEHLSAYVCEDCGKPGRVRQGGWMRCLCPEHAGGRRIAGGG